MPTLFHPTIPDVTFDATDGQLEEAHDQGWLDTEPDYADLDVTVERLGVEPTPTPATLGRADQLTKPVPTGPGAAAPAKD